MKHLSVIKKLGLAAALAGTLVSQRSGAANLDLRIVHFNNTGTSLTFDLYMGVGTGYPNSNTVRGFKSSNIRFELEGVGGGLLDITGASVSNINTSYVDQVTVTEAPGPDQFTGTTDRFSVQMARNQGSPAQADIPGAPVLIATITLPIASGTFQDYSSVLRVRTPTTAAGSYWNDLTNDNQPFNQLNAPTPLPIALLGFDATKNETRVKLDWSTASEKNSAHFEVERSADGKDFTRMVARVPAAGNSNDTRRYGTYDSEPMTGSNYYRLKMVNTNGSSEYSATRQVYFDGRIGQITVYPTHNTDGTLYADLPQGYEAASLKLFNAAGQQVAAPAGGEALHRSISLSGLAAGAYVLYVEQQGRRIAFKVTYQP